MTQPLKPHIKTQNLGFKPGIYWWEVSRLITAPTLLQCMYTADEAPPPPPHRVFREQGNMTRSLLGTREQKENKAGNTGTKAPRPPPGRPSAMNLGNRKTALLNSWFLNWGGLSWYGLAAPMFGQEPITAYPTLHAKFHLIFYWLQVFRIILRENRTCLNEYYKLFNPSRTEYVTINRNFASESRQSATFRPGLALIKRLKWELSRMFLPFLGQFCAKIIT